MGEEIGFSRAVADIAQKVEKVVLRHRHAGMKLKIPRIEKGVLHLVWNKKHITFKESSAKEQAALLAERTRLETDVQQLRVDKAEALHEIDVLQSRIQELDLKHSSANNAAHKA